MTANDDGRLKKSIDTVRENRSLRDRVATEDRNLSDDDRLEMFRAQFFNAALPDLPRIPGFHLCWLTTSNPRDSVTGRLRLGYELLKAEDVPGYEAVTIRTGEYVGCIGVNEMIAAKLPERLYQKYMVEAHHDAPAREDEKLTDTIRSIQEQAQRLRANVEIEDGMKEIGASRPVPTFSG